MKTMLQENTWTDTKSESSECAPAVLPPSAPRLTALTSARRLTAPSQRPASPPPSQRAPVPARPPQRAPVPARRPQHAVPAPRLLSEPTSTPPRDSIRPSCSAAICSLSAATAAKCIILRKNCFYCWRIANHVVRKRKKMSKKLNLRVGSSMADA